MTKPECNNCAQPCDEITIAIGLIPDFKTGLFRKYPVGHPVCKVCYKEQYLTDEGKFYLIPKRHDVDPDVLMELFGLDLGE